MTEQPRNSSDQPIIDKPGQPEQFRGIGTNEDVAPSQHDQHVARERRADQVAGADGGRWGPAGQSKVGGP